jgi:hypothetical protein
MGSLDRSMRTGVTGLTRTRNGSPVVARKRAMFMPFTSAMSTTTGSRRIPATFSSPETACCTHSSTVPYEASSGTLARRRRGSAVQRADSRSCQSTGTADRCDASQVPTARWPLTVPIGVGCGSAPTECGPVLGISVDPMTQASGARTRCACRAKACRIGIHSQGEVLMKWCTLCCADAPSNCAARLCSVLRPGTDSSPRT